jgi:hypothetical protein
LKVVANCFGGVLWFEGPDETGLDVIIALLVDLKGIQAIPPGMGSSSEDAGQLLDISLVIPGGNVGSSLDPLNLLVSGGCIFAFICMKQGQISGPLEAVVCRESVLEVGRLLLISYL